MNPNFLNLFMKKLTRDRVVPIMSARASWLILGITVSGLPSLPKRASNSNIRASLFSLELKSWSTKSSSYRMFRAQQIRHEHVGKRVFPTDTPQAEAHQPYRSRENDSTDGEKGGE